MNRPHVLIVEHGSAEEVCYVNLGHAPVGVWKALHRGAYEHAWPNRRAVWDAITARGIRWGSWGDPAALPLDVFARYTPPAARRTGYTHAWRRAPHLREWCMASVDNVDEQREAERLGWRTFRVLHDRDADHTAALLAGEIHCPASPAGGDRSTCDVCGLCNGMQGKPGARPTARTRSLPNTPNGVVAYRGPSMLDGSPIACVITGLHKPSENGKTGPLAQSWILPLDVDPITASRTGADAAVCGDCPMRPILARLARARE